MSTYGRSPTNEEGPPDPPHACMEMEMGMEMEPPNSAKRARGKSAAHLENWLVEKGVDCRPVLASISASLSCPTTAHSIHTDRVSKNVCFQGCVCRYTNKMCMIDDIESEGTHPFIIW